MEMEALGARTSCPLQKELRMGQGSLGKSGPTCTDCGTTTGRSLQRHLMWTGLHTPEVCVQQSLLIPPSPASSPTSHGCDSPTGPLSLTQKLSPERCHGLKMK